MNNIVSESQGQLKRPKKVVDSQPSDEVNDTQMIGKDTAPLPVTPPSLSELAEAVVNSSDSEDVVNSNDSEDVVNSNDSEDVVNSNDSEDVVKSKDSSHSKESADTDESSTVEATKKRDFHITALSVVSIPADKPSVGEVTSSTSISSPTLISALTITRGGVSIPALVVHSIKSNKPPVKLNSSATLKQALPPTDELDFYDPLDTLPPLPVIPPHSIPLVTLTSGPTGSSILSPDILFSDSKMDFHPGSLLATLNFIHCITLEGFTCDSNSGLLPEIQHLVPLDCGRLLAVCCTCSGSPILSMEKRDCEEEDGSGTNMAQRSGLLLFEVVRDSENILRVREEPVKVLSIGDGTNPIVSMCAVDPSPSDERRIHSDSVVEGITHPEVLLATLAHKGDVTIYSCSSHDLVPIASYRVNSPDGSELDDAEMKFVDCTYCESTNHLVVASVSGRVTLLKINWGSEREETDAKGGEQPVGSDDEIISCELGMPKH